MWFIFLILFDLHINICFHIIHFLLSLPLSRWTKGHELIKSCNLTRDTLTAIVAESKARLRSVWVWGDIYVILNSVIFLIEKVLNKHNATVVDCFRHNTYGNITVHISSSTDCWIWNYFYYFSFENETTLKQNIPHHGCIKS